MVSLNAENAEKYEELCRPKIDHAYDVLMDFLHSVKEAESDSNRHDSGFPVVRLSVVGTSEEDFIHAPGRKGYSNRNGFDFYENIRIKSRS